MAKKKRRSAKKRTAKKRVTKRRAKKQFIYDEKGRAYEKQSLQLAVNLLERAAGALNDAVYELQNKCGRLSMFVPVHKKRRGRESRSRKR